MTYAPSRGMPPAHRPRTATNRTAAEVNTAIVLNALRRSAPQSRSDLSRTTGLSPATVNRLVDRLIENRFVIEAGQASSTGGRPAGLVRFNASAMSVLALDIGGRKVSGAVADLDAKVVTHRERVFSRPPTRQAARYYLDALVALAEDLAADAAKRGVNPQAATVGVPGVVRTDTGNVDFAPALQWYDLPLAALLQDRLGLPVGIANDVNILALAELRHGSGQGHDHGLVVALGTGVGAAIVLDGRIYGGSVGAAGEIGYSLMDRDALGQMWPGFGDLESRIGSAGVLTAYRTRGGEDGPDSLPAFLAALDAGDQRAHAVFEDVADYLAVVIGNASVLLNPSVVVLGGGFGRAAAARLTGALERRLRGRIPFLPTIAAAKVDDAQIVGAAEMAIDRAAAGVVAAYPR